MKALILLTVATLAGSTPRIDRLRDRIEQQRGVIAAQERALEASATAHAYVLTRWSSRGGLVGDPEFLLSLKAMQLIEEARK